MPESVFLKPYSYYRTRSSVPISGKIVMDGLSIGARTGEGTFFLAEAEEVDKVPSLSSSNGNEGGDSYERRVKLLSLKAR